MPIVRSPVRPVSGSPVYSPTDLPAYRGGSSFSPLDLSPVSWLTSRISTLYQDSAGTTPVTGAGQDVGLREDQSGNGNDWIQVTSSARPKYEASPARLVYDGADDALAWTVPTGGVAGTFVQATTEGVTVGTYSRAAGAYQMPVNPVYPGAVQNDVGQLYFDRVLTAPEIAKLVQWLKDTEGAGAGAYSGDLSNFLRGRSDITSLDAAYLDMQAVTVFFSGMKDCINLVDVPLIDLSASTSNYAAWQGLKEIITFPLIPIHPAASLVLAWNGCSKLENFPASFFDGYLGTNLTNSFTNTNLTQTSIDNILVSINSNGTNNGTFAQSGGSAPSATGEAAIDAMRSRGWTVTVTGGY